MVWKVSPTFFYPPPSLFLPSEIFFVQAILSPISKFSGFLLPSISLIDLTDPTRQQRQDVLVLYLQNIPNTNLMTRFGIILRHAKTRGRRYFHNVRPAIGATYDLKRNDDDQNNNNLQTKRAYHATTKREILPVIAMGVGVIGMYSYRALKRMDQEWEDYEEELIEYNLEHGIQNEMDANGDDISSSDGSAGKERQFHSNMFTGGKMAIDLGTLNVRIAHKSSGEPGVVVNREGARATPNHILFDTDGSFVTGTLASAKLYERSGSNTPVMNAGQLIRKSGDGDASVTNYMVEEVISSCAKNALEQVIGGSSSSPSSKALFTIDSGMGGYNVQPVFTYTPPPSGSDNGDVQTMTDEYKDALKNIILPDSISTFVPEPVSAVKGATYKNLLPKSPGPVLVIDVGASATSLCIVDGQKQSVEYYSRLDGFGGETLVETVMDYLSRSFFGTKHAEVSDTMAVQRLYDASKEAIMEFSSGSKKNMGRVQINIPYLSVDEKMQPRHLDEGLSEKVLEAEFNDMAKAIGMDYASKQNMLSQINQNPSDMSSLFSSMIMAILERSNQNPFSLNSVLVVGGGCRSPILQNAIKAAVGNLAGDQFVQEKVIIPRDELIEELVVIGATID